MQHKAVQEAVENLEKTIQAYVNRSRSMRTKRLQAKQLLAAHEQDLQRLDKREARRKEIDKEVLWRLEKVMKTLDRLGIEP